MRTNIISDKVIIFQVNSSSLRIKNLTVMRPSIYPDWY